MIPSHAPLLIQSTSVNVTLAYRRLQAAFPEGLDPIKLLLSHKPPQLVLDVKQVEEVRGSNISLKNLWQKEAPLFRRVAGQCWVAAHAVLRTSKGLFLRVTNNAVQSLVMQ